MKKLSVGELVDRVNNLEDLNFGLKSPVECPEVSSEIPLFTSHRPIEYYRYVSPADTQRLASCESNATCGILEIWISKIHHCKVQLDYDLIYQKAREKFWPSSSSAGLLLGQSADIALDLGILPPDTIIERVPLDEDQIYLSLSRGPLVCGFKTSDGWRLSSLSPYGAINESYPLLPNAGHAVALVGLNIQEGVTHHIVANSWGKYGGMDGFLGMSTKYSVRAMLDRPVSITPGKMFGESGVWKKYVKG